MIDRPLNYFLVLIIFMLHVIFFQITFKLVSLEMLKAGIFNRFRSTKKGKF